MDIQSYMESKGWKVRHSAGELQTQCPFCDDTNKYGHLYVNQEHGAFICFKCDEKGSFASLQVKLGDTPAPAALLTADKWAVWEDLVTMSQDALIESAEALHYLRKVRGLSPETIHDYRLGWAPKDWMDRMLKRWKITDLTKAGLVTDRNYPMFWDRVTIPYVQGENVVGLRAKEINGNILQVKDSDLRLFGVDNVRDQAEIYICEGELDAIYLSQLGYPACGVPGAMNYQEHWTSFFEKARRVYVIMDSDEAGHKGAVKTREAIGVRAKIVELPVPEGESTTDITEYFLRDGHEKNDFAYLIDQHRGQRLFSYIEGIRERDDLFGKKGLELGWGDFDRNIFPGLFPGQVVTVLARTGAGKTGLVTQICHNLSSWTNFKQDRGGPGLPVLLISLEQTKAEISNRLQRIGQFHNTGASPEQIDSWHSKLRICDENRIPSGDLPLLVEEFVEDVGEPPRLLIVDYLGYWAKAFKASSRYEQTSDAIMELKRYAKELQVPVVTPHQVSRISRGSQKIEMDFARDSGVVEETSDFMLSLFKYKVADEEEGVDIYRRATITMQILKSRHGNVGREISLLWAPYSLALVEAGGPKSRAVAIEQEMLSQQASYEDVMQVHRGIRAFSGR